MEILNENLMKLKSDQGNYIVLEPVGDDNEILPNIVNYLLGLRLSRKKDENFENTFWSFRGQRDREWYLDIKHRFGENINDDTDFGKILTQFKIRMSEFKEHEREITHLNEKNDWDWLFYAQHHRLCTRLLDWTSNPLVAVYFAVENIESQWKGSGGHKGGAVWALQVNTDRFKDAQKLNVEYPRINPATSRYKDKDGMDMDKRLEEFEWLMITPPPITRRIARQSGKFTYHTGPANDLKRLDKLIKSDERLIRININEENSDLIRQQLGIMNIHHASLFPSPTGVAEFVNQEWPKIGKY